MEPTQSAEQSRDHEDSRRCRRYINEDSPARKSGRGIRRTAATYSPTWWGSTIGDGELNFSVRNGKRWFLTAIATAIYYLREQQIGTERSPISFVYCAQSYFSSRERYRAISTGRLNTLLHLHLLPINVVVSHDPQWKSHLEDGFALRCFQRLS